MYKNLMMTNFKKYSNNYILNKKNINHRNLFNKFTSCNFSKTENENIKAKKEESKTNINSNSNMKYISHLSRWELKDLILDNKNAIKYSKFFIRSLPDPNAFGEALLFKSPLSLLHKYSKNYLEFSGCATVSLVTILNYFGLIFTSTYLFPYLAFLSFTCVMKYYGKQNMRKSIYQIHLLNEHQVKVTYVTGNSEVVDIKNIYLSQENVDNLLGSENIPKNYTPEQISRTPLVLGLRIGQQKCFLLLRQASLIDLNTQYLSFCELKLLLGILDKDVKKLAVAE